MLRINAVPFALLSCLALIACGGSQSEPKAGESEPAPAPTAAPAPSTEPASMTAEACEASGGTVVGDIGDGAIHRPDYKCPSGARPSGGIRAPEGGPIAIEGSVCCPK